MSAPSPVEHSWGSSSNSPSLRLCDSIRWKILERQFRGRQRLVDTVMMGWIRFPLSVKGLVDMQVEVSRWSGSLGEQEPV